MSSLAIQTITFAEQVVLYLKSLSADKQTAFLNLLLMSKEKGETPEKSLRLAKKSLTMATPRQLAILNKKFLLDE